ncbi:MAG: hypothetical protein WCV84_01190 [Patescibacteria group bacterium]
MENKYDKLQMVLGHDAIFGRKISLDEIKTIIAKYPAFQWLDLAVKIEAILFIKRTEVPQPQIFLAQKFFPQSTQCRLHGRSVDKAIVFSPGQLNFLRKLAIGYGGDEGDGTEIPMQLVDISKVLLGVQDLHNSFDRLVDDNLEKFCQYVIRNGYLNGNPDLTNLFFRAREMYLNEAAKIEFQKGKTFNDFYNDSVGIKVEQAMALGFAIANPLFQNTDQLLGQTTIINPNNFFQALSIDSTAIDSIVNGLTIDFPEAKKKVLTELVNDPKDAPIGYNLDLFRKTPFIRLESGKLVCGNFSCLIQKTTQNLIWMPKSRIKNLTQQQSDDLANDITNYRGVLFEGYVRWLCEMMRKKNSKISFHYIPKETAADRQEVADALLIQDDKLLIIEAKSRQFMEAFKYTGDWGKDGQFIDGLINEAAKQIQTAADKIRNGQVPSLPMSPDTIKRVYPVIVTYEPIPMHAKIQRFVRQRVQETGNLTDDIFAPLEIIDISDLESFMDSADSQTLIELLEQKGSSGPHASETNFNNFFAEFVNSHRVISNGWQSEQWVEFTKNVCRPNLTFK